MEETEGRHIPKSCLVGVGVIERFMILTPPIVDLRAH